MVSIKNKRYVTHALRKTDRSLIEAELWVDSVSELPTADGIEGYTLAQGSIAYVIQSGGMYVLDSTGSWYSTSGAANVATTDYMIPDEMSAAYSPPAYSPEDFVEDDMGVSYDGGITDDMAVTPDVLVDTTEIPETESQEVTDNAEPMGSAENI